MGGKQWVWLTLNSCTIIVFNRRIVISISIMFLLLDINKDTLDFKNGESSN